MFVMKGKVILDAARQMAVEADYCPATGLHGSAVDRDDRRSMSPAGYMSC